MHLSISSDPSGISSRGVPFSHTYFTSIVVFGSSQAVIAAMKPIHAAAHIHNLHILMHERVMHVKKLLLLFIIIRITLLILIHYYISYLYYSIFFV